MLKYLKLFEQFITEKKPKGAPDFHHSDAPDAEGRFKDLSIKDLAAWLIKTRKKDVKKISGSLTQQIVFNRKSDPKYAEKMEKTRKEVYKQLGREDLLKEYVVEVKKPIDITVGGKEYKLTKKGSKITLTNTKLSADKLIFRNEKEFKEWADDQVEPIGGTQSSHFGISESIDNKSSLNKIYIAQPDAWGDHNQSNVFGKPSVKKNFINLINKENVNDLNINKDYPIINYNNELTKKLLKENRIKSENIYSHPDFIELTNKDNFHKLTKDADYVPLTVYNKKDALEKLNFPIIAKPALGHSGAGIKIIKSKDQIKDLNEKNFDTFSNYIDKSEEIRFFTLNGKPIFWMERTPLNSKAKNGDGSAEEEMEFGYSKKDIKEVPKEYLNIISELSKTYSKLPYMCFDMMKDKDNKVYVIEPNIFPGTPFDSLVEIYKNIYEDFYNKPIDNNSMNTLDKCAKDLINLTLKKDGGKRFSIK